MSKKIDKAMLKSPDLFISTSDKVLNFIEEHIKTVGAIASVLILLSVGYVTAGYLNSRKEQKAAEALYGPEAVLKKAEADVRDERAKKTQALLGDKTKKAAKAKEVKVDENLRPVDFAKDYAPAVEKIKAAIKANAGTKAAMVSALNLSYFLSQQQQFAEALDVLNIPTYHPGNSDLLGGFYLMHRGVMLLENNQVEPAIEAYQSVLSSESLAIFHPEAQLKLGVAYELKGDAAKAREAYEKVGRQFPDTEASSAAQQYIRLLELNAVKKG
jgi:predicted negative regulator of RcsB-dependent stress response